MPKIEIRNRLTKMYKSDLDNVVVYGMKTKFGGGKSRCFAIVYDSLALRKKYDATHHLVRDGLAEAVIATRGPKKEMKRRQVVSFVQTLNRK